MLTLKEIREQEGYTQGEVSKATGINIPTLSNYEAGIYSPKLEDIVVLEKVFNTHLDWPELDRIQLKDEINILLEHYPTATVINFCARWLQTGKGYGANMIKQFARMTELAHEEPLMYNSTK